MEGGGEGEGGREGEGERERYPPPSQIGGREEREREGGGGCGRLGNSIDGFLWNVKNLDHNSNYFIMMEVL